DYYCQVSDSSVVLF
nr:immunoglobulin light chain junction region [Macaca mulatta]MOW36337.1 immunoglobulin light chain junction region [Macaca mulatta]MOW36366.1 immunoglobulin light chain junction region [Macaca mulatta]MOW36538.1 immunoglobulin light chain junction region [Macaca mulatta]MOW36845.1 immunoglobulin light chain junction region [Macaca mulatta]